MSVDGAGAHAESALDAVMHVPLEVTAEVGRKRMALSELLKIGTGSIVELDRAAGAPVDIVVSGTRIGRGEIVAVGDNFGIRVTEVIRRHGAA